MTIWKTPVTIEQMNARGVGLFSDLLGIKFIEMGDDYVVATMTLEKNINNLLAL